ncbi:MAG TPA: serine/threonine-protein kinase, partial [Kofleriaceae bacterium]|nr:serine/threonine-protein kinase [Kofleriaceae bacterium]
MRSRSQLQMEQMFLRVQRKLFGEAPPTTMAHYSVVRTIGQGAMGVVYEAVDARLGREVALKLVLPDRLQAERGTPRLLREARAMAKISHPNVVAVYDVGESDGVVFIAMEYVRGVTLRQWLANAPRSLPEILDVFVQAGAGLAAAHHADIVHRDFKPDNVLIGSDGRARVLDFGLAHPRMNVIYAPATGRPAPAPPSTGIESTGSDGNMLVGTIAYMSPEQLQSKPLDGRSDQFAFCVALYEALFGQRPFSARSFNEFVDHVLRGELAPVESPPRLPSWLRAVLRRGLSIAVEPRFGSMTELVGVLTAGRHLLASQRAQPALPGAARDHLLGRLASVLDEHVASTPAAALVRVQRPDDLTRQLAVVAHDARSPQLRAAFAAYHERLAAAPDAPARLRPIELVDDEACLALVFEDIECVTLGGLLRQGAGRDLGLALQLAAALARGVHALAQVGYAIDPAALAHLPIAV